MTIVQVQPKSIVIDDSFAPPSAEQLTGAGVAGEIRYFSNPTNNPKNWTRARLEERWALGIATIAIHEQSATDHLGGAAAGRLKADVFAACAEAVGYPRAAPAMVSCDTGPTQSMVDYAGAFEQRIRQLGWSTVGAYVFGPTGIQMLVDNGVCTDILWQAYAGSAVPAGLGAAIQRYGHMDVTYEVPGTLTRDDNGNVANVFTYTVQVVHGRAHAFQRYGYQALFEGPFAPGQVDENVVLRPLPMWLPGGARPVTPTPTPPSVQEDAMLKLIAFADAPGDIYIGPWHDPGLLDTVRPVTPEQLSAYARFLPDEPADVQHPAGAAAPDYRKVRIVDAAARATTLVLTPGTPGPKGDQGPKGDTGPAGAAPVLNRAAIVAALQKD